jgi:hypothetical protein
MVASVKDDAATTIAKCDKIIWTLRAGNVVHVGVRETGCELGCWRGVRPLGWLRQLCPCMLPIQASAAVLLCQGRA